jgi:predicted RNA binding protein YcfA (HicA-like mRNA interferase family)
MLNFQASHQVLRAIKDDGCFQVAERGSHRQFKHSSQTGRVTIAGKLSDELAKGSQMSILKQAGLRGSDQP